MTSNDVGGDEPEPSPLWRSIRLLVFLAAAIGSTIIGALYSSVNFAWVCMVNSTEFVQDHPPMSISNFPYLDWHNSDQEIIFAGYSIGGLIMSLPAGWIINRFGSRLAYSIGVWLSAAATLLIPICSQQPGGVAAVVVLRIIVGIGCSVYWPITFNVCSWWAPKQESGFALAIVSSGFQLGQFLGTLIAGAECRHVGWELIFYINGAAAMIFATIWFLFYRNDPSKHKLVSEKELTFITRNRIRKKKQPESIPWLALMLNLPIWSCIICRFAAVYMSFAVNQFAPTFLKRSGLPETTNGYLSSLPLLTQLVGRFVVGPISDIKIFSNTVRMKALNTFSFIGAGLFALGLAFTTVEMVGVNVFLLCGIMFLIVFITGGFMKAPLLMAPQFSAIIGSLMNISGMAGAIVMPFVVDSITTHKGDATEDEIQRKWDIVFYTVLGIGVVGAAVFLVFGSGKKQKFAEDVKIHAEKPTETENETTTRF